MASNRGTNATFGLPTLLPTTLPTAFQQLPTGVPTGVLQPPIPPSVGSAVPTTASLELRGALKRPTGHGRRAHSAPPMRSLINVEIDSGGSNTAASDAQTSAAPTPVPCAGGGCPRAQSFRSLTGKPLCTPLPSRPSPTMPGKKDKYLSTPGSHASATRAWLHRIWVGGKPGLVCEAMRR